jgi:hypothetical protein
LRRLSCFYCLLACPCPFLLIPRFLRLLPLSKISDVMGVLARNPDLDYVHPETEVYTGLWCLHAGATVFLAARLWTKLTRRHGVWYDDYILITCWVRKHLHSLTTGLCTNCRAAGPHNQQHHHHYRVRHWLREPDLGYSNAHPHRHQLLSHSAGPESLKDSFWSNIAEVNQRLPVAARTSVVLYHNDERIQSGQGKNSSNQRPRS